MALSLLPQKPSDVASKLAVMNAAPELLEALEMARQCIAWCRKHHADVQTGDGLPIEVVIDAAIAKARGAQ